MKDERVKVNGLAEFAHYYNLNTDMILEKIDNNAASSLNRDKDLLKLVRMAGIGLIFGAATSYFLNKRVKRLEKKIRELEDQRKVDDFFDE